MGIIASRSSRFTLDLLFQTYGLLEVKRFVNNTTHLARIHHSLIFIRLIIFCYH